LFGAKDFGVDRLEIVAKLKSLECLNKMLSVHLGKHILGPSKLGFQRPL
jgi:hypothetical protein